MKSLHFGAWFYLSRVNFYVDLGRWFVMSIAFKKYSAFKPGDFSIGVPVLGLMLCNRRHPELAD